MDTNLEHFNFKNLDTVMESDLELDHYIGERPTKVIFCAEVTLDKNSYIINLTKKTNIILYTPVI